MGGFFNHDSKAMQLLSKIADIFMVGILWIILCMTIVGFGPACTAAYYTTAKSIRRERGNLLKEFWKALKDNFWSSLILGLLILFFGASLFFFDLPEIANAVLNKQAMGGWKLAFRVFKIFLFLGFALYLFPIQSRFQTNFIKVVVTALLVMFRHVGSTLLMIAILLIIVVTVITYPPVVLLMPGILFYLISFPMEKVLSKLLDGADLESSKDTDQWYLEK